MNAFGRDAEGPSAIGWLGRSLPPGDVVRAAQFLELELTGCLRRHFEAEFLARRTPGSVDGFVNERELFAGLHDIICRAKQANDDEPRQAVSVLTSGPDDAFRLACVLAAGVVIGNGCPPPPVLKGLEMWGNQIKLEEAKENQHLGRPEQRRALKRVIKAARLILRRSVVEPMRLGLADVILLADAALTRVSEGSKQGQGKYHPQAVIGRPKDICALVVQVAWHVCRGKWVHDKDPRAILGCELLWGASGGDVHRNRAAMIEKRKSKLGLTAEDHAGKGDYSVREIEQMLLDCEHQVPENSIWREHMEAARGLRHTEHANIIRGVFAWEPVKWNRVLTQEQQRRRDEIVNNAARLGSWYQAVPPIEAVIEKADVERV
jgi:hypothetical protein